MARHQYTLKKEEEFNLILTIMNAQSAKSGFEMWKKDLPGLKLSKTTFKALTKILI